jgi:opacity protein-like surface antigen
LEVNVLMRSVKYLLCTAAVAVSAQAASAQTPAIALEVRGGVGLPTGDWNENDELDTGYGFGGNVRAMVTPTIGVYAGWEMYTFSAEFTEDQQEVDTDVEDSGFRGGVSLSFPMAAGSVSPFVEVGAIYNTTSIELSDGSASLEVESDRSLGFEAGLGVAVPLGQRLSVTPVIRYRSHDLSYDEVELDDTSASYFSFDLGLRLQL